MKKILKINRSCTTGQFYVTDWNTFQNYCLIEYIKVNSIAIIFITLLNNWINNGNNKCRIKIK